MKPVHPAAAHGAKALHGARLAALRAGLGKGWEVAKNGRLIKDFAFQNFRDALAFTNQIGEIAEQQSHHPEILLGWGKVSLSLWTDDAGGLSEKDFIFAASTDEIGRQDASFPKVELSAPDMSLASGAPRAQRPGTRRRH